MVNIEDILKSKEELREEEAEKLVSGRQELDDIMLAMDITDTLRREDSRLDVDLTGDDRRLALIDRIRTIYEGQGLDVSEAVIIEGILALEDKRFEYVPPKPSLARTLARLYVFRQRWLPLFYGMTFIIGSVLAVNYLGFVRPAKLEAHRIETVLGETLPESLSSTFTSASELAASDDIKSRLSILRDEAQDAIDKKDLVTARNRIQQISILGDDLALDYQIRIVSRPGEYSGIFRINEDGDAEVRNYYLIVEGITASGELAEVLIHSEEDQKSSRVKRWGVRVPEDVFNAVAADKRDDQIIQNAVIGHKKRGHIKADYSVDINSGMILDW